MPAALINFHSQQNKGIAVTVVSRNPANLMEPLKESNVHEPQSTAGLFPIGKSCVLYLLMRAADVMPFSPVQDGPWIHPTLGAYKKLFLEAPVARPGFIKCGLAHCPVEIQTRRRKRRLLGRAGRRGQFLLDRIGHPFCMLAE